MAFDVELSGAAALTEFGRYNGDCMWDMLLAGLHVTIGTPLDLPTLNTMVDRAVAEHRVTQPNGAATMTQIVGALHDWYGITPAVFYPYRAGGLDFVQVVHPLLTRYAGYQAILIEVGEGGNLPDNERGIHFHGIACLAHTWASGVYGCANGDSSTARTGALSVYHWTHLRAAIPVAVAVLPAPKPAGPPVDADVTRALALAGQAQAVLSTLAGVLKPEAGE